MIFRSLVATLFKELFHRYKKYLNLQGDYIEKSPCLYVTYCHKFILCFFLVFICGSSEDEKIKKEEKESLRLHIIFSQCKHTLFLLKIRTLGNCGEKITLHTHHSSHKYFFFLVSNKMRQL